MNSIVLIAAVANNNVIGDGKTVPWHIPEDLQRFKAITSGHCVIMGRKTYESIGKPLKDRKNIIISKSILDSSEVDVCDSLENAILRAKSYNKGSIFVAGGGEVYAQSIDLASRLEITHIDLDVSGNTKFPNIDLTVWRPDWRETHYGLSCGLKISYVTYSRRK